MCIFVTPSCLLTTYFTVVEILYRDRLLFIPELFYTTVLLKSRWQILIMVYLLVQFLEVILMIGY